MVKVYSILYNIITIGIEHYMGNRDRILCGQRRVIDTYIYMGKVYLIINNIITIGIEHYVGREV